jgi:arylsulfatase A-like enzyme
MHRSPVLALFTAVLLMMAAPLSSATQKPNIILILADDLGYGDLGVTYQNSRDPSKPHFATPQLDQMAAQGTWLRQHYTSAPVCAPARASILLGQHQGHCAVRDNQFDKALPSNHTLATVLKQAGYHTGCIGKWGLQGPSPDYPGHPLRRGFDEFFGFLAHVSGHTYYHDDKHPLHDGFDDVTSKYLNCYSTDLFTARAKHFITTQVSKRPAEPFFLYLAYTAVHNALNVPGNPYPKGSGKSGGMQWPMQPMPQTRDTWIHPDYAATAWPNPMKRYATMARRLDDPFGDVLQLLRDLHIDENTLVVFTSDNGPANEGGADPRNFDSWGPFDGFKRDCWEGGLREPTITWWPGHIPAGKTSDVISAFWDWMPTFADAAGLAAPAQSDGVSLLPSLTGIGSQRKRGYVYVEYFVKGKNAASADVFARKHVTGREQQQILRVEDYVAIRTQIKSATDPIRLYNVTIDPHQDHDLSHEPSQSARVARMTELLSTIRRPEPSAPRPYDNQLLPAVTVKVEQGTLDAYTYKGPWPWVPDFAALTPVRQGKSTGIDVAAWSPDPDTGASFTGYINVPADGLYTFSLTSTGGAHLWLHEAHLIDDDFNHTGAEISATIPLKAGLHPIRLFYRRLSNPASLALSWTGPGMEKRAIGQGDLASEIHH